MAYTRKSFGDQIADGLGAMHKWAEGVVSIPALIQHIEPNPPIYQAYGEMEHVWEAAKTVSSVNKQNLVPITALDIAYERNATIDRLRGQARARNAIPSASDVFNEPILGEPIPVDECLVYLPNGDLIGIRYTPRPDLLATGPCGTFVVDQRGMDNIMGQVEKDQDKPPSDRFAIDLDYMFSGPDGDEAESTKVREFKDFDSNNLIDDPFFQWLFPHKAALFGHFLDKLAESTMSPAIVTFRPYGGPMESVYRCPKINRIILADAASSSNIDSYPDDCFGNHFFVPEDKAERELTDLARGLHFDHL